MTRFHALGPDRPKARRAGLLRSALLCSALALAAPAALAPAAFAQDKAAQDEAAAADTNPVVARVNGEEIRMQALSEELRSLPPEARQVPQAMLFDLVLDNVISAALVAQAADAAGVDESEAFAEQMAIRRRKVLTQLYLQDVARKAMTEEAVAAAYEAMKAEMGDKEEVHARHILVEDEAKAKEIIAELDGGMDFAKAAETYSTGPSKTQGGDLGFFAKEQMVPEFAEAAFALEPGSYTAAPVQTQFGWHVIKSEAKRKAAPPPLDQVRGDLQQKVVEQAITAEVERLTADAEIEKVDRPAAPAAPPAAAPDSPPAAAKE